MPEHTPGPWHVGPHQLIQSRGWSIRIGSDDSAVAYVLKDPSEPLLRPLAYVLGEQNPELKANAKLIAAAPDLLESLEDAVRRLESMIGTECECDNTHAAVDTTCCLCGYRAAIAKAKAKAK